jgi:hypothetical protein
MLVSLPTGITASIAPRGATEMTLNFVMAVPNVSSAFSVNVRVSEPYSRSGNNSKVRGDEPTVAFRRYNDMTNVLLRFLETGTEIFPHSITPHGSHVMLSEVASAAETEADRDTVVASAVVQRSTDAMRRISIR